MDAYDLAVRAMQRELDRFVVPVGYRPEFASVSILRRGALAPFGLCCLASGHIVSAWQTDREYSSH